MYRCVLFQHSQWRLGTNPTGGGTTQANPVTLNPSTSGDQTCTVSGVGSGVGCNKTGEFYPDSSELNKMQQNNFTCKGDNGAAVTPQLADKGGVTCSLVDTQGNTIRPTTNLAGGNTGNNGNNGGNTFNRMAIVPTIVQVAVRVAAIRLAALVKALGGLFGGGQPQQQQMPQSPFGAACNTRYICQGNTLYYQSTNSYEWVG